MEVILPRDGAECVGCRRAPERGLDVATTEHLVPRVKGGPSWLENEVAACRRCNHERGDRNLPGPAPRPDGDLGTDTVPGDGS